MPEQAQEWTNAAPVCCRFMTLTARTCQQTGPAVIDHMFATTRTYAVNYSGLCTGARQADWLRYLLIATFNPERLTDCDSRTSNNRQNELRELRLPCEAR